MFFTSYTELSTVNERLDTERHFVCDRQAWMSARGSCIRCLSHPWVL